VHFLLTEEHTITLIPGETWVSRYQNVTILYFIEAKAKEVVVTTGAIRHAKLQIFTTSKPTPGFSYRMDAFLLPNQQCSITEGTEDAVTVDC